MSDLRELYQQMIIDHGRHPRNFGCLPSANRVKEGYNPLCGDKVTVYLQEENGIVFAASFTGTGCAISMASASLMTEALKGKSIVEIEELFGCFYKIVTGGDYSLLTEKLGKLTVLRGVAEYPSRVKCATLAWHAAKAALMNSKESVCTE